MNGHGNDLKEEQVDNEKELTTYALPRSIIAFLGVQYNVDENNIPSDHDYFLALLAVETCRALIYHLGDENQCEYFQLDTDKLEKRKTLGESLIELLDKLTEKREALLKKMVDCKQKPLVEKFLDALDANEDEKKIFRFVLCINMIPSELFGLQKRYIYRDSYGGYGANSSAGMSASTLSTPADISQIFNIPLPRIMKSMQSDSIWVKEQIYYNNVGSLSPMAVSMFQSSVGGSVLQGYDITMAQYDELKSSILQQTLLEHPPFFKSEVGKKVLKRNNVNIKPLPESAAEKTTNVLADALKVEGGTVGGIASKRGKRDRLFDAMALSTKAELKAKVEQTEMEVEEGKDALTIEGKIPADDDLDVCDDGQKTDTEDNAQNHDEFGPYKSDLTYLEDQVRANIFKAKVVQLKVKLNMEEDEDVLDGARSGAGSSRSDYQLDTLIQLRGRRSGHDESAKFQGEKKLEKIGQKLTQLQMKIKAKIHASAVENSKVFRLEQLCEALHLSSFEKSCILLLLQDTIIPNKGSHYNPNLARSIGTFIGSFCATLEDKMKARSYFYKTSTMIEEGILTIFNDDFTSDLMSCQVKLDRRLFDFLIGLDTEMSELVNGSHLYKPDISVDDVILPEKTKKRVLDAVLNFDKVKDLIHETGMDEKISYGLGQILLFYGASGTGKTMLANAIAAKLGVKILLVNFPDFGVNSSGSIIKFLFREARINNAILFFDECESLFMSREKMQGNKGSVNMLLTELERFDGVCILATNRAYDLDEAMQRRISLSIEFNRPDHIMREKLFSALMPPKLPIEDDINFDLLGRKYELVGGTIKNAIIQSISIMIQRSGKKVSMEDLEQAASEQVRNQLCQEDFDRRVVPTNGIETMVLEDGLKETLNSIVQYSKAQSVLFGQWGFDKIHRSTSGISVLFHGVPGTGKTMAAEAIGFDLGKPLLVVNVAELVSKWVGETGKNISKIFTTAKSKDAILVFDEAEGLFGSRNSSNGSTGRHDNLNVGLLLQKIENFAGICVVITNMKSAIDEAFFRRFRFVLEFKMPNAEERENIWKVTLPEQCPVAEDVDFRELGRRYEMSGGGIKNALLRAATAAALRPGSKNELTMEDLKKACEGEQGKMGNKASNMDMYS